MTSENKPDLASWTIEKNLVHIAPFLLWSDGMIKTCLRIGDTAISRYVTFEILKHHFELNSQKSPMEVVLDLERELVRRSSILQKNSNSF